MQPLVPDQSSEGLNALKQLTSCNTAVQETRLTEPGEQRRPVFVLS